MSLPLEKMQQLLKEEGLTGWLLYDFHHMNSLMWQILKLPDDAHITRRICYWIPTEGKPVKIVHRIEEGSLDHLAGDKITFSSWQELDEALEIVKGKVAMEYSTDIPAISKVDAGFVDRLRKKGVEVVSSALLLQHFTSILNEEEIASHLTAAAILDQIAQDSFRLIYERLMSRKEIFEGEVQSYIIERFKEHNCITEHAPIVARGPNSASPHYTPQGKGSLIEPGDLVMIDLWCKLDQPRSIFADITRVAVFGTPTVEMEKVFHAVRGAQKAAVSYIEQHLLSGEFARGSDVDDLARSSLQEAGFGSYILHRTGHNIHYELHGPGAHLDNLETHDTRLLLPYTCCSMEPALYLEGKWGIRLEHDLVLFEDRLLVTGSPQEELFAFPIKKS